MFNAFQSPAFRRYFAGQCISLTGTWLQQATVSWMAYQMTGSSVVLGWVGFASQIPTLLVGPFAGVLADRVPRRKGLLWTQVAAMAQASLLTLLVVCGWLPIWALITLTAVLGLIQALDNPLRQAYVPELFENDRERLGNAIAVNSATFNAARLMGPMLAGWLITHVGSGASIGLNALSYSAVIWALAGLPQRTKPDKPTDAAKTSVWTDIGQGFTLAYQHPWMRLIFTMIGFSSLFVMPYTVLLPVMAVKVFHGGAIIYGNLMSAAGFGSLVGALCLASRHNNGAGLTRIMGGYGLMGLGLLGLSQMTDTRPAYACLFVVGFGWIVQMASCNIRLQQLATDENRGRIMSLYSLSFIGMAPFGSLLAGWMARQWNTQLTLLIGGAACLIASVVFWQKARHLPQSQPTEPLVIACPPLNRVASAAD